MTIPRKFNDTYSPQILDGSEVILYFRFVERKRILIDSRHSKIAKFETGNEKKKKKKESKYLNKFNKIWGWKSGDTYDYLQANTEKRLTCITSS